METIRLRRGEVKFFIRAKTRKCDIVDVRGPTPKECAEMLRVWIEQHVGFGVSDNEDADGLIIWPGKTTATLTGSMVRNSRVTRQGVFSIEHEKFAYIGTFEAVMERFSKLAETAARPVSEYAEAQNVSLTAD